MGDIAPEQYTGLSAGREEVAEVEHRLGLSILREGADFLPDIVTDDEARCDVRKVLFAAGAVALKNGVSMADIKEDSAYEIIGWLQSQTNIANNLLAAGFGRQAQAAETNEQVAPRERFQGKLMSGMHEHAQTLPLSYLRAVQQGENPPLSDNLLVVAPTGTGKTVMEAKLLRDAGVGNGNTRGMVVVADQSLHRQYLGETGDNTFRHWLGEDTEISSYWQYHKQAGGKLQIITKQSVEAAIEAGALNTQDIDIAVVDEGHVGLEPKLMQQLNQFARVYYFTATPAYDVRRDLRQLFRHIEIGNITDCIYEGIVNDTEVYTFRASGKEEIQALAARLAYNETKEGRQVVVYCRPGDAALQAKEVAQRINRAQIADGHPGGDIAARISGYESNSQKILKAYEAGEIRVLTTVGMLGQGYNGNINTAIIIGPNSSLLQLVQRIGRAVRPNHEYRTRLIEIIPAEVEQTVTIWNALGLDEIKQGQVLESKKGVWNPVMEGFEERNADKLLDTLEASVKTALLPEQPIGRICLSRENMTVIDEGYIPVSQLMSATGASERKIRAVLDKEGYHYIGLWTPGEEGTNLYERWYEPAAAEYFHEHPLPPGWKDGEMTLPDLADLHDVSIDTVERIGKKIGISPVMRTGKNHRSSLYFTADAALAIGEAIAGIPEAAATDISVGALKQELGKKFVIRCLKNPDRFGEPVYKRRFAGHGIKGFDYHLTENQASAMRLASDQALATDDDIALLEIAALAGISKSSIFKNLTPEEKEEVEPLRATPTSRHGHYMPRAMGLRVAERLMVKTLPVHLVPHKMVLARVDTNPSNLRQVLRQEMARSDSEIIFINLGGTSAATACMPWNLLKRLEEHYGLREGAEPIDYARIAHKEGEVTSEQWKYSTSILKQYIDSSKLAAAPEFIWQEASAVADKLNCTMGALSVLVVLAGKNEQDMQRHPSGETILHAEFVRRLRVVRNRPYSQHENWVGSEDMTRKNDFIQDEIREVLQTVRIDPEARRLGLNSNGKLDICFAKHAVQMILQSARMNRHKKQQKKT